MASFRVGALPEGSIEAAAEFYTQVLPEIRIELGLQNPPRAGEDLDLVLIFPPAPYDHRGWRLAAVQDLAREAAPRRVNAVVGDDEQAIAESLAWLEQAPGVTGQMLAIDPT